MEFRDNMPKVVVFSKMSVLSSLNYNVLHVVSLHCQKSLHWMYALHLKNQRYLVHLQRLDSLHRAQEVPEPNSPGSAAAEQPAKRPRTDAGGYG